MEKGFICAETMAFDDLRNVCVCLRVCVRACVCACVRACVRVRLCFREKGTRPSMQKIACRRERVREGGGGEGGREEVCVCVCVCV